MSFIEKRMPEFILNSFTDGEIKKYDLKDHITRKNNLVIVFYPFDFTTICPTEIQQLSKRKEEFLKNKSEVIFVSRDSVFSHKMWAKQPQKDNGVEGVSWPMISDLNGELSNYFDFLGNDESHSERGTVILNKEGLVKHYSMNCKEVGRKVDEILRVCKAINHVEENGEMCLVDWNE